MVNYDPFIEILILTMADKSFFEFKLEADTTTPSGTMPFINTIFLDIVNYDEVTPYYFNS